MKYVEAVCLLAVTAATCFLLCEGGLLLHRTQSSVALITSDLHNTQTDYQRVAQELVGTMAPLRATLKASKDSSDAAVRISAQATLTLNADLVKLGVVLDGVNKTLGDMDSTVTQTGSSVTANLNQAVTELQPAIANLVEASKGASVAMNNPLILSTMSSLDATARETALTSAHVEGSTADIQAFIHRETTPVRGTWNVIKKFLQEFAGPAASVTTAIR